MATITFPVRQQWLSCEFHLLPLYLPLLLSLRDMDCLGIVFANFVE